MTDDPVSRGNLLETIELMVRTATMYSLPNIEHEIRHIRRYYDRVRSAGSDPVVAESLELDFYSILEEDPRLKQLYIASSYADVLASCICGIESLIELSRVRPLTSEELSRKHAAEQARQKVDDELERALQPLRGERYYCAPLLEIRRGRGGETSPTARVPATHKLLRRLYAAYRQTHNRNPNQDRVLSGGMAP